ncbi:phage tail protein [Yersinia ruckeri]|uniref:phage tail-collar fiber domain-containing protein n=2 Tax=Yersinia TaxID=629 RepID=UPI00223812BD|nr:phage tail protein [Yersinia ruckeri]MCW6546994.1 phage tail protein [Yersinia ruckeri]MCW6573137.1 phage tail protein [Yersinia ruckeri]UZX55832.1 phage tail protein [Yersinia ruckeri]
MSQSIITTAFEQWKAQEAAGGNTVVLDEFVLANVPGLDPDAPIARTEGLPPAEQIVHRQRVNKTGVVNNNAVVYSVTIGTEIGDFDFNWIGLVNQASGTVAMIVHAPTQRKIANASGQQGNALTRSFLMEYDGAASETAISIPAETWQIDFTARLTGIDEMQRLINLDHYGSGAFFADGFLVAKTGQQYYVTAGHAYVGGLRTYLAANQNITVTTQPIKVWADVSLQGNVVSQWETVVTLTLAADLQDYQDNSGFMHRVFAVASIDVAGNITDLRPKGSLGDQANSEQLGQVNHALAEHERSRHHPDATTAEKGFVKLNSATDSASEADAATPKAVKIVMDNASARLAKERNGGDIPNAALFRTNIGLGDSATRHIGNTVNTVASGDDPRFYSALQVQYNLDETNLNTLNKDKLGIYPQYLSSLATVERNYPINLAGSLSVFPGGYGAIQEYTTYLYGLKYVRGLIGNWNGNGPWGTWELMGDNIAPVGIPMPWPAATPPRGWLKCNGSAFDKTRYPQLAVVYPSGSLPDLRSEFIRGLDDGRGIDSGRGLLSNQDSENKQHNHGVESEGILHYSGNTGISGFWLSRGGVFNKASGTSGGNESRPRNIAFNFIVRAA